MCAVVLPHWTWHEGDSDEHGLLLAPDDDISVVPVFGETLPLRGPPPRARKTLGIALSLLFKKNFAVAQVLKAGTGGSTPPSCCVN